MSSLCCFSSRSSDDLFPSSLICISLVSARVRFFAWEASRNRNLTIVLLNEGIGVFQIVAINVEKRRKPIIIFLWGV